MLTELCQYLHNWFTRKPDGTEHPKYYGQFTVADGALQGIDLIDGQYFRIMGSLFNDGVHKAGDAQDTLTSETFEGAVWIMGIPPTVIQLATDIAGWQAAYGGIDSAAMSPYNSESFGGYSYSKSGGGSSDGSTGAGTWQAAFAKRLDVWKKI